MGCPSLQERVTRLGRNGVQSQSVGINDVGPVAQRLEQGTHNPDNRRQNPRFSEDFARFASQEFREFRSLSSDSVKNSVKRRRSFSTGQLVGCNWVEQTWSGAGGQHLRLYRLNGLHRGRGVFQYRAG